jgi:tetratricopeptide (TPR) repeat protein
MVEAAPQQALRHAVFLRRLAEASSGSSQARLGHGAFLTLRLVDLLDPQQERVRPDAFGYQLAAMDRVCRELPGDATETAHLVGLVQAAADAYRARDAQLAVPALLAYAHYLEDELLLGEALDVLETVVRVGGDALRSSDQVASRLRVARVLRKLNEFDAALEAYDSAQAVAVAVGDLHAELISRIGQAQVARGRGKLRDASEAFAKILFDAERLGDQDAQARAHQEMAVVLSTQGQPTEAIPHVWRAFELYGDEISRGRALADLGAMLLMVGDTAGAERALRQAVSRGGEQDFATNALVELMHCASARRDRVGFERWRERCETRRKTMPPNILADFALKSGIGRARFGQYERAETLLAAALSVAEAAGLHEFVFRVERIRDGLRDCRQTRERPRAAAAEAESQSAGVREVSAALAHLDA